MDNRMDLATSLSQSINNDTATVVSDLAEIGLDSVLQDGLLKDIPFVSTVVSLYHIGSHISELHQIKKLAVFIDEINENIVDEDKRNHYIEKLTNSSKKLNKELEYILVLLNRYLDYYKPRFLAKLYLAYLDNNISWNDFSEYAEIIDRLLLSDFGCLCEFMFHGGVVINQRVVDVASVLRLQSVGFVEKQNKISWNGFEEKPDADFDYFITSFGNVFTSMFETELREIYNYFKQQS